MHYNRIREAIRFVITSLALCAQISYADFVVQDSIIHRGLLDTTEESVHILENGLLLVHNAQELIISGDLIVDTGGSFVAVNQIPDGSFSAGAVGDSRFENNGLVRFLNTEAASQIPHNFYLDTFTNTGEFQFFTYGQSNKVELRIETNSFTNEGQMIISQESSDLGSFEILANNEDVSNEGTICLENINITQGAPLNGQGCINLQNSLLVLMSLPNSGNQVYLQGSSTYLVSQYVYGETGIEIYGFYNNAIVGIDATISEFIYYPASGLLELFACEYCYRILLSIGFGYSTDGFEVVDAGGYQLNALRYTWPVPTGRNIPSLCLQCAETPIVPVVEATAIPDLGNQDNAVVITQDSDGYWTTISQNIDQTITSIVTIVGVDGTTTQTHLVFNTFVENELIEYTITASSRSHLSVFTSQVDGGDYTTVTGFVNEYTQDDGIWTSTTDTGYIREETLVTRVAVGEPEQTQEFLMAIYHFQEATHYIVVSVLPEPTAYTETQYFTNEQGGIYTALVVATSDEANWWYTTTRTIPRSSYISTITTGDGDDVVTLIVSAITNDEGSWVTPTSYHTPTSQTHLTEITTTNDLGEESVLIGVYRESTNNRGEWISTVLAGSLEATTVTSRATLTIDELVYTKDVQLVAYNYDETDLFTETIILDDPVAAESSYTVSDGNEVYTMVVRVTSDEANWWYTTTRTIPRSSYISTITTGDGDDVATLIVSAITNEEGSWVTPTSYHTPTSQTHLTEITTTNDLGEESVLTGVYRESTNNRGEWISTVLAGSMEATTVTSRATLTIDELVYTKDVQLVAYNYDETDLFTETIILDDPVAAESSYTVSDGNEVYTMVVRVTSDEANWWYTTTRTIPRSSYISTITTGDGDDVATLIVSAITNEEGSWVTPTSYHTPTSQTHLTEITTTNDLGEESVLTGVYRESTNNRGEWISTVLAGSMEATTVTSRATLTIDELVYTKDVQLVAYNYDETDLFTETIILDDPVAAESSYTVSDGNEVYTMVVRVTSDEANWWYTTTRTIPRSSYISTITTGDGDDVVTLIVSAITNDEGSWVTPTSYHTPTSQTHLTEITTTNDLGQESVLIGVYRESTNNRGEWISTVLAGSLEATTVTSRATLTIDELVYTKDVQLVAYNYDETDLFTETIILDDPVAAESSYTVSDGNEVYTMVVRVTSDEANWWYTTTRTIPRSSYISTITTGDGDDVATLIVSAITNEEGSWVTPTSYHTPTSQTHLTEITTTNDLGEESVLTGVYRESTNNRGEWISTVLAGSMEATTVTSRATLTIDELVYTKDVQLVAYNYDETDLFTETIILDDPVAAESSYTVSDGNEVYTMVVRVTSDEANWWYTTTEILERISTTDYSVQSDNETSEANETTESGVQIVASESDDQSEIEDVPSSTITSGAEYGGGDAQTLIEVLTYTDESGVVDVATFLLEVELVDVVVWVTRTYTNILQTTTFTLPSSVNTHETQVTDPVRVVGYNFEGFGFFYETFALASPAQFTKTLAIETDDGATSFMLQIVTSDDSYMWYTTIEQALSSSYTSTVIVSDEDSSFHTGEVNVFTNDMGAWTTQTSFSTPYSRTYYETESTSTGIDGENVGAMNLIEVKRTQMSTLVSVSYTEVLETTTFESVIEASSETFTVQVIGLNFLNFGFVFQTVEIQASTSETIFSIESEYDEPSTEAFDTWESESEFVSIPDTFISLDNTESQLEFTVDNTSASEISTKASDYLSDSTFYLVTTTENDVSLTTEITNGNIVTSEPLVVLDSQLESIAAYLSTITTSNYEGQSLIATILMQLSEQNVETWTTITHSAIEVTTFISHRTSTMADGNSSLATKSVMVVAHSYESYVPALQTFDLFDPNEWAITTTIDDGVLQNTVLLVVTSNSDDQYWYATVDTASPSSFTTTVEFLFSFSYEGLESNTAVVNKFTDEYGVWVTSTSLASPIAQTYLQSIRGVNEVNQITTVLYLVEVSSTTILSGITVTQPFAEETTMANFEESYDAQPTDETFYVEQSYIDSDRSESRSDRSESRSDRTTGFDKVQETRSEGVMSRESQKFGSSPALQIDVGSFTGTGKETVISTLTQTNRLVDCEVSTFGATKSIYVTRGENAASVSNSKEGQAWDQITSKYVRSSNNGGIDIGQNTDSESISITLTISHSTSMQSSFTSPAKGPNSFYESYLFDGAGFAGVRYNLSPFAKQFSILVLLLSFIM